MLILFETRFHKQSVESEAFVIFHDTLLKGVIRARTDRRATIFS